MFGDNIEVNEVNVCLLAAIPSYSITLRLGLVSNWKELSFPQLARNLFSSQPLEWLKIKTGIESRLGLFL